MAILWPRSSAFVSLTPAYALHLPKKNLFKSTRRTGPATYTVHVR